MHPPFLIRATLPIMSHFIVKAIITLLKGPNARAGSLPEKTTPLTPYQPPHPRGVSAG